MQKKSGQCLKAEKTMNPHMGEEDVPDASGEERPQHEGGAHLEALQEAQAGERRRARLRQFKSSEANIFTYVHDPGAKIDDVHCGGCLPHFSGHCAGCEEPKEGKRPAWSWMVGFAG